MRFLTLTSLSVLAAGPALAASKNPFSAEFWKLSNTDFIVSIAFLRVLRKKFSLAFSMLLLIEWMVWMK